MPRALNTPPFPETPGNWLSAYRYRGLRDGTRLSAEHLAGLLGVSGATVRRWESDRLRPTQRDLLRFADVCSLTPIEREFLLRAFSAVDHETAPAQSAFEMIEMQLLRSIVPAFVMDSLFYIRIRNTYMPVLSGNQDIGEQPHAIKVLFHHQRTSPQERAPDELKRWIRTFWFASASLSGTTAYRDVLASLRKYPEFEASWWALAQSTSQSEDPINLPLTYTHPEFGQFYVLTSTVILPPAYHIRHYLPADEMAREFIIRTRGTVEPGLQHSTHRHWIEHGS